MSLHFKTKLLLSKILGVHKAGAWKERSRSYPGRSVGMPIKSVTSCEKKKYELIQQKSADGIVPFFLKGRPEHNIRMELI